MERRRKYTIVETDESVTSERELTINLITSTKFIEQVKTVYDVKLIVGTTEKMVNSWCIDYFDQYKTAPKQNFQKLFESKKDKGNINPVILGDLEGDPDDPKVKSILDQLSKIYEQQKDPEENIQFHIDRTKRYFIKRQLEVHKEQITALIDKGDLETANKLIKDFKPLESSNSDQIKNFIWDVDDIRLQDKKKPQTLIKPWLKEGQHTFIHGECGSGKSLLSLHLAYLLGMEECDHNIEDWYVKNPTGCLYIDGELGAVELEERLSKFEYLGKQRDDIKTKFFPIPEFQESTENIFALSVRENQLQVTHWLKEHPKYKLVILDSVTTLFGLSEENDNSEFSNKINPLLRDFRAMGVACILLHHSGKDPKRGLRGASSMGAMVHNIFSLTNHEDKDIDEGEAWFTLDKGKQREGGFSFKKFTIHYFQNSSFTETDWETSKESSNKKDTLNDIQVKIIKRLLEHKTYAQIMKVVEISNGGIGVIKRKAIKLGYITPELKATDKWNEFIQEYRNEGI